MHNSSLIHTCKVYRLSDLGADMRQRWEVLRGSHTAFSSPFFSIEFIEAAERAGREPRIGVIFKNKQIVGFLPFEIKSNGCARPVANQMNDAHGIIGGPFTAQQLLQIIDLCGIKEFSFHNWFGSDEGINPFSFARVFCCGTLLNTDPSGTRNLLHQRSYTVKQQKRKTRKLIRDYGSLSFSHHKFSHETVGKNFLKTLFDWKSRQYRKQNTVDLLSLDWTQKLLMEIFTGDNSSRFQGKLSILSNEDSPVAMHFGIQEGPILHYWFPAFNPSFGQYSPGMELYLQIADHLESNTDVQFIDMGYGCQPYKSKVTNKDYHGYEGKISKGRLSWNLAKFRFHSKQVMKKLPMKPMIRKVIRSVSPNFGISLYD